MEVTKCAWAFASMTVMVSEGDVTAHSHPTKLIAFAKTTLHKDYVKLTVQTQKDSQGDCYGHHPSHDQLIRTTWP